MSASAAVWYLDTSALAKLVQTEPESAALRKWLERRRWIISDLHRTELRRACARASGSATARAERLLAEADVIKLDAAMFDTAGQLQPATLRSLDAIHLAAAMALGTDLAGIVAYDERLLEAAVELELSVASPS